MSPLDFLLERWGSYSRQDAIIWNGETYSYTWLTERVAASETFIQQEKIQPGSVVILEGDFSPNSIAFFLALIKVHCIIVPLTSATRRNHNEFAEIALGEVSIQVDDHDRVSVARLGARRGHPLYEILRTANHPGLVVFSSGSTGKSKAAVHDFVPLLEKFRPIRRSFRTLTFLLFDHLGGLNTLLYILSNGGCVVTVAARTPDRVLEAVERWRVELMPTSPTFLNLILLSGAYERYDLSSIRLVTYGTEPMSESTLKRFCRLLPNVEMLQTYGLSEIGVMRSKSKSSDSLWVKIGGEEFQTRVVDGLLEVKAKSAMLGYLNAPSPFTPDGWLITGDSVEVDGEYVRILGRKSELINVGGEKVYPCEVEGVIQEMEDVADVTVYGEKNPIMGNIVCARVRLKEGAERDKFAARLKQYCRQKLNEFKVPVRVELAESNLHSERFKKERASNLTLAEE